MKVCLDPENTQVGQDDQSLANCKTALFDFVSHAGQTEAINDPDAIELMKAEIARHFTMHDAPAEIYSHFGIEKYAAIRNRPALSADR